MMECDIITSVVIPLGVLNLIASLGLCLSKLCRRKPSVDEIEEESDWSEVSTDEEESEMDAETSDESEPEEDDGSLEQLDPASDNDLDIISEIRNVTASSSDRRSGSIESMTGKLISATRNIADALDTASNIPTNKKRELASLLKGVPEFISKITKMDGEELGEVITRNTPKREALSDVAESEFLMQTLDELRR
jgi:hypothetical protein